LAHQIALVQLILSFSANANPMQANRIVRQEAYELTCSAKAADGGAVAPTLVLCKQSWQRRPRVIDVPGDYVSEEVAIYAAQSRGLEWIQHYGH
jgi:hypothetical protein